MMRLRDSERNVEKRKEFYVKPMFTVLPVWLDGEIMVGSPVQAPSQSLTLDEAPNTNGSASGVLGDDTSFGELE